MLRFHRSAVFCAAMISTLVIFLQASVGAPVISGALLARDFAAAAPCIISSGDFSGAGTACVPDGGSNESTVSTDAAERTADVPALHAEKGSETLLQNTVENESALAEQSVPSAIAAQKAPADTASSTVMPIRLNSTITTSLVSQYSSNVYTFTVAERGYIALELTRKAGMLEADTGWIITLSEEYYLNGSSGATAYRTLTRLKTDSTEAAVKSSEIGVLPGSFRVIVTSDKNYSADTFSLCACFTADNSFEIECNDTLTRYTSLYPDKTVYGSSSLLEEADVDYYMFRVTSAGYADIAFEHDDGSLTSVGWHVSIIDMNGTEYYYQTSRIMDTVIESGAIGLAPGCYFVKIVGHVYTPMRYSLTLSLVEANDFETENNDSQANPVTVGVPFRGATVSRSVAVDRDFFSFSIPEDGYVSVKFAHKAKTEVRNGWNILLYNSNGELLYADISDWSVSSTISEKIGLAKGCYYLCIDSENMYLNTEIYTASVSFTADANREKEPNNSFADATVLKSGEVVIGSTLEVGVDYDTDIYKISCEAGSLTLSFAHAVLPEDREGWTLTLCDANGIAIPPTDANGNVFTNVLGSIIYSTSCNRNTVKTDAYYKNIPAGTYYIKVETGLYYSHIEYTLSYK